MSFVDETLTPYSLLLAIELTWGAVKMWMRRFPRAGTPETLFALQMSLDAVDHELVFKQYRHRGYL